MTEEFIEDIVNFTSDAYSFKRYGRDNWREAIKTLLADGHRPIEVDAIMRSSIARQAADSFAEVDEQDKEILNGGEILKYMKKYPHLWHDLHEDNPLHSRLDFYNRLEQKYQLEQSLPTTMEKSLPRVKL